MINRFHRHPLLVLPCIMLILQFELPSHGLRASTAPPPAPIRQEAQQPREGAPFADEAAGPLLSQIREALEGRSMKKMSGAFDFSKMRGASEFKDGLLAFFNQYDSIRVRFDLLETSMENAQGVVRVDAEMEETQEDPQRSVTAPVHKHVELRFVAANGPKGWKFIDVQPRSFFF